MDHFKNQSNFNLQRQEAFILDETKKDKQIQKNKWKDERKFQIIAIIIVILIISSLFM